MQHLFISKVNNKVRIGNNTYIIGFKETLKHKTIKQVKKGLQIPMPTHLEAHFISHCTMRLSRHAILSLQVFNADVIIINNDDTNKDKIHMYTLARYPLYESLGLLLIDENSSIIIDPFTDKSVFTSSLEEIF